MKNKQILSLIKPVLKFTGSSEGCQGMEAKESCLNIKGKF